MTRFDHIIVGQGLAGTTLAWALRERGFRVCILDRGDSGTSSQIAAGLITPVTGLRMAASWRYAEFFSFATAFYERIEQKTGSRFIHPGPAVRFFVDDTERAAFEKRAGTLLRGLVGEPRDAVNAAWFATEQGGFEMPAAARLDAAAYLEASRECLRREDSFHVCNLDVTHDIEFKPNGVWLPRFDLAAERVLFCQGFEAVEHALFRSLPFNPAKGEILTLRIPELAERRVMHRGIWLAPLGGDRFLAGSTFDRERLDRVPTTAGHNEIVGRLRAMLRLPFEVIDHRAGVRPAMRDGRPVIGQHPANPRLGIFNGLGSKGALLAPFFAFQFAATLATE